MGIFEKIERINTGVETGGKNDVTRVTNGRNGASTTRNYDKNPGDKNGTNVVTTGVTTEVTIPSWSENSISRQEEGGSRGSRKIDSTGDRENNFLKKKLVTDQLQVIFKIGYAWIKPRLPELLAVGWTRPELFRRAKFSWPIGPWGVAWLSIWAEPDVMVTIGHDGEIIFQTQRQNRTIKQTAWPKSKI